VSLPEEVEAAPRQARFVLRARSRKSGNPVVRKKPPAGLPPVARPEASDDFYGLARKLPAAPSERPLPMFKDPEPTGSPILALSVRLGTRGARTPTIAQIGRGRSRRRSETGRPARRTPPRPGVETKVRTGCECRRSARCPGSPGSRWRDRRKRWRPSSRRRGRRA
jgi:hypothetical protein